MICRPDAARIGVTPLSHPYSKHILPSGKGISFVEHLLSIGTFHPLFQVNCISHCRSLFYKCESTILVVYISNSPHLRNWSRYLAPITRPGTRWVLGYVVGAVCLEIQHIRLPMQET